MNSSGDEAIRLYHEALSDYRDGKAAEADRKLRLVIAESPSFDDAYEALSVILYNLQRYDEAIEILKKWVTVNPHTVMAHTNLSRCYVAKGMIAEAENEQSEARRLTWREQLKEKKKAEAPPDYEERVQRYKKIIEFDPADVLGYFTLGTLYAENGKTREAMDTFRKAVEVNPDHTSSYLGLGQALEALGDRAKAAEVYRKGISVGDAQGDMMPAKKMESRLKNLEKEGA